MKCHQRDKGKKWGKIEGNIKQRENYFLSASFGNT